jgi:tetratricopeptide (TPR) repeat protein
MNKANNRNRFWEILLSNPYIFISVIGFLVYSQSLFFDFSYHDDDIMIVNNKQLFEEQGNTSLAFKTDAWFKVKSIELYRPLQSISYILDYNIAGTSPWIFHATNILLHILCCLFLYKLLILLSFSNKLSLLGSTIQAVHFTFLHSVCWIPARGDLLLTLFSLISFIYLIKFIRNNNFWFLIIHFVSFLLALLSKESAIVLPFLFLLYSILVDKKELFSKHFIIKFATYAFLIIPYLHLRSGAVAVKDSSINLYFFITNLPILPETIIKYFIPINFSVMPTFKIGSTLFGIILIVLLIYYILKSLKKKKQHLSIFGGLFFLALVFPAMIYKPDFSEFGYKYLDHRIYLPGIGITILLLQLIKTKNYEFNKKFNTLFILLIIVSLSSTIVLSKHYQNGLSYFSQAIESNNKSALAYIKRGNLYKEKGNFSDALKDYSNAIKHHKNFMEAYRNRGQILNKIGKHKEALNDIYIANKIKPNDPNLILLLGELEQKNNNYDNSFEAFNKLIELEPQNEIAYFKRGDLHRLIKNFEKAINDYSQSLNINNKFHEAWFGRALAYGSLNNFKNALNDLNQAIKTSKTKDGQCYYFRGIAYLQLNKTENACLDFNVAHNLGVTSAQKYIIKSCK